MKLCLTATAALLASCVAADTKEKKPQVLRRNRNFENDVEERTIPQRELHDMDRGSFVGSQSSVRVKGLKSKNLENNNVRYIGIPTNDSDETADTKTITEITTVQDTLFNHHHGDNVNNNYQTRIVGGEEAAPQTYPYYVDMLGCGGSLIAPRVVLSAAHCGNYVGSPVVIGGYQSATVTNGLSTRGDVQDQATHPSYSTSTDANDFTLLLLTEDANLPYSTNIVLSLDQNGVVDSLNNGDSLTVVGLGRLAEGASSADTLREVVIPYVDDSTCAESYGSDFQSSSMFCAGTMGKDSCQGDSGGPIVIKQGNIHIQTGVVSWGSGCGSFGYPGVYAKVSSADSWIKSQVCDVWGVEASFCPGGSSPATTPAPPSPTQQPVSNPPPQSAPTSAPASPASGGCFKMDVDFRTDDWPEENSLFFRDAQGNSLLTERSFAPNKLYRYTADCLIPTSCYALDFYDTYGDGLQGSGYLKVMVNGATQFLLREDVEDGALIFLGNGC